MSILSVRGLVKKYPAFTLGPVSFDLEPGRITGFIGRNGAGKTTTLKSMLGFVHPDAGDVEFFGLGFKDHEAAIKSRIGFVSGGVDYYSQKKIKTIASVTAGFYANWDAGAYSGLMDRFRLDPEKTPAQLSEGMKVKFSLCLALSHKAELLVLDEPTSGLDPVSRDELLDVFLDLKASGVTILFSTHITSDLDKCADRILYIRSGRLLADSTIEGFLDEYRLAVAGPQGFAPEQEKALAGLRRTRDGASGLFRKSDAEALGLACEKPSLESAMVHLEKEFQS
ncbi:MAG: ABC transporter ATP-binding protein [Spirochaetes bacterium]|nr:ABC transporter ATP-binding protein [Spirochaetota bacterium]MBU1081250.1 ABC transporter ATP-binding protein [Spirochaetota bacterium]